MNSAAERQRCFSIAHASDISVARRFGTRLAAELGFDEATQGRLALVITEASTNILKHAADGKIVLYAVVEPTRRAVAVLAIDAGPGIVNLDRSLLDGISTAGTAGTGLGAMRRLADDFDVYSQPGKGSVFYMNIGVGERTCAVDWGVVSIPKTGEEYCGDAWQTAQGEDSLSFMVADGLGHGEEAAEAANAAAAVLESRPNLSPDRLLDAAHAALRGTRGAAVAVASLMRASGDLAFAGVGNIAAVLLDYDSRRQLISHNGIVGHNVRRIQRVDLPRPGPALLLMHSDGLATQWDLRAYPGLHGRHPALVAAVLYRDFARGRDDVTVLAARLPAGGG